LAVLRNYDDWINDFSLPDDFEIVFTEINVYYFKCLEARELDNEFGDLNAKIRDMENLIASDLEDAILECDGDLRETFDALADLDCILSFADVAAELGYVRPSIAPAEEKCILIRHGGHPLQELLIEEGKQFVRNDVAIDAANRINVVTGPNFSGKSCYARQVGILTYMAQLGSFLPCEGARISIVDQILSQFSTVETCAVPQSSFQLDLTRMSSILRFATSSSLVIIDEFGKGTSSFCGMVKRFGSNFYSNRIVSSSTRHEPSVWHWSTCGDSSEAISSR
jgi:DNA mismatch repair protein MSH5